MEVWENALSSSMRVKKVLSLLWWARELNLVFQNWVTTIPLNNGDRCASEAQAADHEAPAQLRRHEQELVGVMDRELRALGDGLRDEDAGVPGSLVQV